MCTVLEVVDFLLLGFLLESPEQLINNMYSVEWDVKLYYTIPYLNNMYKTNSRFWDKHDIKSFEHQF